MNRMCQFVSGRIPIAALVILFALATSSTAMAQGAAGQNAGGGQDAAGGGIGGLTGGLNPDQVFSQGIQRDGAVGQSTAPAVGASATSAAAGGGGAAGGRAAGGLGAFGGGGGLGAAFGSLFGGGGAGNANSSTPPIRTRLRSAVVGPVLQAPQVQRSANLRFRSLTNLSTPVGTRAYGTSMSGMSFNGTGAVGGSVSPASRYDGVNVQIQNRTATLSGAVGTESDRRMSELLMRLEPGVSRVENRLQVYP